MIDNKNVTQLNGGGRNSNLELFRIITMLLIVAHHYCWHTGIFEKLGSSPLSFNSLFYYILGIWGKTGVNCFVLITGYFMCTSNITVKKFLKLALEVVFYSFFFYVLFVAIGVVKFSPVELVRSILPVRSIASAFTSAFLVFYLCIPFLNILIRNMAKRQHGLLLLLLLFAYTFLPSLSFDVRLNYVSWFCVIYLVAAYIRKYPIPWIEKTAHSFVLLIACLVLSIGSVLAFRLIGQNPFFFVMDANKVLAFLTSVTAFIFFKNINIKNSSLINTISASTFAVYLIHDNSLVVREWLWSSFCDGSKYVGTNWGYVHMAVCVLGIFITCIIIDIVRKKVIESPVLSIIDRHLKVKCNN